MTQVEQDHIVDAFTFELGKVDVPAVVERMLLGSFSWPLEPPRSRCLRPRDVRADVPRCRRLTLTCAVAGPAMIDGLTYPVDGRVVQILANDGADLAGIRTLKDELVAAGATAHVVAPRKGAISGSRRTDELTVDRSFHTASPRKPDAVIVAARAS